MIHIVKVACFCKLLSIDTENGSKGESWVFFFSFFSDKWGKTQQRNLEVETSVRILKNVNGKQPVKEGRKREVGQVLSNQRGLAWINHHPPIWMQMIPLMMRMKMTLMKGVIVVIICMVWTWIKFLITPLGPECISNLCLSHKSKLLLSNTVVINLIVCWSCECCIYFCPFVIELF